MTLYVKYIIMYYDKMSQNFYRRCRNQAEDE